MNLPNSLGIVIGIYAVYCGVMNKKGYNDVGAPLTEKERGEPNKPTTLLDRVLVIGFGVLMVALGNLGKFRS